MYFAVLDRKTCLHGINLDIKHLSLTQPIAMLYTDDPTYADYLTETFEMLWQQSVPAHGELKNCRNKAPRRFDWLAQST